MFESFKGARLGIFIFIGTVLIVLAIFLVGSKDLLFQDTFKMKTYFTSIEGLKKGASVRLSGIDVGTVSDIRITDDPTGRVEVEMDVTSEVRKFIRVTTRATIETEGLVGNKLIVLTIGENDAPLIEDNGYIQSKSPVSMSQIMDEAQSSLSYVRQITEDFAQIVDKVNKGEGTIGMLINDEELYTNTRKLTSTADRSLNNINTKLEDITNIVTGVVKGVDKVVVGLDSVITEIDGVVSDVRGGQGVLGALIADNSARDSVTAMIGNLVKTTEGAKLGAERFAESMEALKHNWLFKSYFEERGYWDVSDQDKALDEKLKEINDRTEILEQRINELKQLEDKAEARK
jgi:phospholipid/cholesterol/gamma-HCH transport system substrate-binding protein